MLFADRFTGHVPDHWCHDVRHFRRPDAVQHRSCAMEGNLAVAIQVKRRRNISVISVYIYMREIKLMITILNKYCYLHNSLNR